MYFVIGIDNCKHTQHDLHCECTSSVQSQKLSFIHSFDRSIENIGMAQIPKLLTKQIE